MSRLMIANRTKRGTVQFGAFLLLTVPGTLLTTATVQAQGLPPEGYHTRQSQCRHAAPAGRSLAIRHSDSGTRIRDYTAERVLTYTASAAGLEGGDILVCTEYGRVEIIDSDDDQARLQIRMEGSGEGSDDPGRAAARVIDETAMHVFMSAHLGRMMISVWHSTLGFTTPGAQPAWVSIRLQVPVRGAYRVRTEAFHGLVAIRRLTLAGATMRGAVGEKFKGIPGFIFGTELDNVTLAGDVDIDNLAGIPGARAPATAEQAPLTAPILVKASVAANARLSAVTGGDVRIAIQPAPDVGVLALGESNEGTVRVGIDGGVTRDSSASARFRARREVASASFDTKRHRLQVLAQSGPGSVHIASIPAAPLARPDAR